MNKKVKAWAVVDWDMWKRDKHVFGKVFVPHMFFFTEAIFMIKEDAEKYSQKLNSYSRSLVVPVSMNYLIPDLKRYKKNV